MKGKLSVCTPPVIPKTIRKKRFSPVRGAQVEQIKQLIDSRDARDKTGLFYTEGMRFISEAMANGLHQIQTVVAAPELLTSSFGQSQARELGEKGVPILEVSAALFRSLSLVEEPQGIGAVVRQRWDRLHRIRRDKGLCWVALDTIRSPGNLGTILRTCDAVGAAGLILVGGEIDPYAPLVVRATMGALFSLRFARVASLNELLAWKKTSGATLVGTSPDAASDYQERALYPPGTIVWLGSERQGLSEEQQAICDRVVRIPMVGRSDSLNVAVAAGVLLYEVFNQRRKRR